MEFIRKVDRTPEQQAEFDRNIQRMAGDIIASKEHGEQFEAIIRGKFDNMVNESTKERDLSVHESISLADIALSLRKIVTIMERKGISL